MAGIVGRRLDAIGSQPIGRVPVKGLSAPVEAVLFEPAGTGETTSTPRATISVLVVDDQRLLRAGFSVILNAERDIAVVGEASDGLETIAATEALDPDVVVMDVRMPNMDGLEGARRILAQTRARVLMLTTFDTDEYVFEALRAGASGFLLKDVPGGQLVAAVRSIAQGDSVIDPSITKRLITSFVAAARPDAPLPKELFELMPREAEILKLLARGLSNAEISAQLFVEESTVKTHVGKVLQKLGLRDRVQAVVYAYETGFVPRA